MDFPKYNPPTDIYLIIGWFIFICILVSCSNWYMESRIEKADNKADVILAKDILDNNQNVKAGLMLFFIGTGIIVLWI